MVPVTPTPRTTDLLAGFGAPTRAWFGGAFAAPTQVQTEAWSAIRGGSHALVIAPTGSGKTLAAFLWAIDRILARDASSDGPRTDRILYVSPLKALAADVERNLASPLTGIRNAAAAAGTSLPPVTVGTRTGDTTPSERRRLAVHPPDILITTPESLFLMLTSSAREGLREVGTVVVDEIHAVAGTKRGAHLALSLERLDLLLDSPAQRIGLSATARPTSVVAELLAGHRTTADGGRPVVVVEPPARRQVDLEIVVPVEDLTDIGATPLPGAEAADDGPDLTGAATSPLARASVWPHVEERIVDLATTSRSTIVFTNSRRGAERLTSRLNEIWARRQGLDVPDTGASQPAAVPGQAGTSAGVDGVFARAHHGSMSRAERSFTEGELKAGRLPVVVATSSLELGIDMGSVDLVVLVGSPPSVASGLQRVGRAGHAVGVPSHGVLVPTHTGDLVPAAVTAARMRAGELEPLRLVRNPLDVLAQQIVAMVALEDWPLDELEATVRRAAPFAQLPGSALRGVLDMLTGRYPSEAFGELRARLTWDRGRDVLQARPGAQRLAVTSGGTIPDRGLYGVFLAASAPAGATDEVRADTTPRSRGGRRVGELDEEMVYESRVGDTITLGSTTWRIDEITPDRVLVTPAPGLPGRMPFWKGDSPARPAELGRAIGAWTRTTVARVIPVAPARTESALAHLAEEGLDPWAAGNVVGHLREQHAATGVVPDDRTIVVERFRDEIGDWRVVVHSPFGARIHAPWALLLGARLRERYGVDVAAMHADDGIVLRLPDIGLDGVGADGTWSGVLTDGAAPEVADELFTDPADVAGQVRDALTGSAHFAARFREAAARALLLPRRSPDRRQPLWQQRQRSAQLLEVAAGYPEFPIVHEAARECLQDDFDVESLTTLMADVAAGRIDVVHVDTTQPSPFARSLLLGYTAQNLYGADAPLAEQRAATLALDPTLLDELLGGSSGAQLADLLDPTAVEQVAAELDGLAPERRARGHEGLLDLLRRRGPSSLAELVARSEDGADVAEWLATLRSSRQVAVVRLPGLAHATAADDAERWLAVEDAARVRDALGAALPVGLPDALLAPVDDPLGDLVRRHARTHVPFPADDVAARYGLPVAVVREILDRLVAAGELVRGRMLPAVLGGTGAEYADRDVVRRLRRRSLALLRAEVEPAPAAALGLFLPRWQRIGDLRGRAGLLRAIEQLAGAPVPASDLEQRILPGRVVDYSPALLDALTTSGEVLWAGHAPLSAPGKGAGDGIVSLHLADTAPLTLPVPSDVPGPAATAYVLTALDGSGAHFLDRVVDRARLAAEDADDRAALGDDPSEAVREALWHLVWTGRATNDSLGPLRALLGASSRAPRTPARPVHRPRGRFGLAALSRPPSSEVLHGGGRWSLLPTVEPDPTVRAHALAMVLLDRHGIVTRALAPAEQVVGRYPDLYKVLTALEAAGQVRRGYFVEHLGGSQFAVPGAVDVLRDDARAVERRTAGAPAEASVRDGAAVEPGIVLAACDPANPYGAALVWPASTTEVRHRPGRKAGAAVVLVDGVLALYVERGGRTLLSFTDDAGLLGRAAHALAASAATGYLGRMTVRHVDGTEVFGLGGPVVEALTGAGFALTPRGLRVRGAVRP
ncbi:DEAD/DEAH box helicase [Sanguibacter sp. HDW7]|uniref:Lhr family helicase n=1 Tax=Sanguibacter sp. HDW7 TaxID=2714931 RepID=UPI00140847FE|nr:DEAD/DEAH box helicase [Sanguibacter sp. HDW7]QIK84895.1 DEAD/DEAH box helicase [Sanguibacter sp. HDW7]